MSNSLSVSLFAIFSTDRFAIWKCSATDTTPSGQNPGVRSSGLCVVRSHVLIGLEGRSENGRILVLSLLIALFVRMSDIIYVCTEAKHDGL